MSKYHAGKPGFPLCGAGSIDRFKTTVLTPAEWNAITDKSRRCEHCVEIIRKRREARK